MAVPTSLLPEWATAATFPAGTDPWSGQPTQDSTARAALAAAGHTPDEQTDAETYNSWLALLSQWVLFLIGEADGKYGDGSDGPVTITGGETILTRTMYYSDLTVTATGILSSSGFHVFANGVMQTDVGSVVRNNGSRGVDGDGTGVSGGSAAGAGSLAGGGSGGASGRNAAGSAGGSVTTSIGGAGGAGGDSNHTGGPGAAGTVTPPTPNNNGVRHLHAALGRVDGDVDNRITPGGGGGGGGGGDDGDGGSGGGCGGMLNVWAETLRHSGVFQANGGDGGDAFTGPDADGNGGGGGGGGGGQQVTTRDKSGVGTFEVLGGAGGAGHLVGDAGAAGSAGTVLQYVA